MLFLCLTKHLFRRAVTPPGLARDDWKIIRALSEVYTEIQYKLFSY